MRSKRLILIGTGNIGSRHLQALRAVKIPLEIFIVDPSEKSLELARGRYESMPKGRLTHEISYLKEVPHNNNPIDLAVVATCSNIRADVVRKLLKKSKVRYLILEKLLFDRKADYDSIGELLKKSGTKTWVNCPMRMMPSYCYVQSDFLGRKLSYSATWSGYGLITSAIHYLDHMVFLSGSDDFVVDTNGIDKVPVKSKRKGFLDLTGVLRVLFKNGSTGVLACYKKENVPILVQFCCDQTRCIVRETESKSWVSKGDDNWKWKEVEAPIPFQSQLTTELTESLLSEGTCQLTSYEQSVKIHLQLLEPVQRFLNKNSKKKYNYYPFT